MVNWLIDDLNLGMKLVYFCLFIVIFCRFHHWFLFCAFLMIARVFTRTMVTMLITHVALISRGIGQFQHYPVSVFFFLNWDFYIRRVRPCSDCMLICTANSFTKKCGFSFIFYLLKWLHKMTATVMTVVCSISHHNSYRGGGGGGRGK